MVKLSVKTCLDAAQLLMLNNADEFRDVLLMLPDNSLFTLDISDENVELDSLRKIVKNYKQYCLVFRGLHVVDSSEDAFYKSLDKVVKKIKSEKSSKKQDMLFYRWLLEVKNILLKPISKAAKSILVVVVCDKSFGTSLATCEYSRRGNSFVFSDPDFFDYNHKITTPLNIWHQDSIVINEVKI